MAMFPCVRGRHPYRGKANSIYVGQVSPAEESIRWKLRLCSIHALEVYQYLAQFKVTIEDDTVRANGALDTCMACFKPASEVDWQLFVTCYPPNQDREDYWAKLHVDCTVPQVLSDA